MLGFKALLLICPSFSLTDQNLWAVTVVRGVSSEEALAVVTDSLAKVIFLHDLYL